MSVLYQTEDVVTESDMMDPGVSASLEKIAGEKSLIKHIQSLIITLDLIFTLKTTGIYYMDTFIVIVQVQQECVRQNPGKNQLGKACCMPTSIGCVLTSWSLAGHLK